MTGRNARTAAGALLADGRELTSPSCWARRAYDMCDVLVSGMAMNSSGSGAESEEADVTAYVATLQYDVFISYSHADREWVHNELLARLEDAGLRVSIDDRDFDIGVPILTNIERAVDSSHHTLLVLSPNWVESEWSDFESLLGGTADPTGRRRKLIPLMLAPCTPPARIAMLNYADFTDPAAREREMTRLLRSLRRAHVFISYKRDAEPDRSVAMQVYESLGERCDVFIDQTMPVGTNWADRIEEELARSDYLISFLSAQSIHSEMVAKEIKTAHRLAESQHGRPAILPVRLAYRDPFPYPLSEYLNPINWALWESPEDTPHLIEELTEAIAGGELRIGSAEKCALIQCPKPTPLPQPLPFAQPVPLEMPEGTMDPQSRFYVERQSDEIALATVKGQGVTITIKGPRQVGKSSLLARVNDAASKAEKHVIFVDFQLFDRAVLANPDLFFRQFCTMLGDELQVESRVDEYWNMPLGNSQRCTRYLGRYLLKELDGPLLLSMDEIESVFDTAFRSDFFGMLRYWHNSRATGPVWKQLDLALVTSTEPYQLIENLNQSPFNVGEVIELADFTAEQVADLNRRHGSALQPEEEDRLMQLVGGHPYLTRRALYVVAGRRASAAELFATATEDRGPFGDHLRHHLVRLHDKPDLRRALGQIIRDNTCEDDQLFFRLQGAGLVRREGRAVVPRCRLYAEYFRERLRA